MTRFIFVKPVHRSSNDCPNSNSNNNSDNGTTSDKHSNGTSNDSFNRTIASYYTKCVVSSLLLLMAFCLVYLVVSYHYGSNFLNNNFMNRFHEKQLRYGGGTFGIASENTATRTSSSQSSSTFDWDAAKKLLLQNSYSTDEQQQNQQDSVTIVLISDRINGIIPSLGSILQHTTCNITILLIGDDIINRQVQDHFFQNNNNKNVVSIIGLTVEDIELDLVQNHNMNPIWTWSSSWRSSMLQSYNMNENNNNIAYEIDSTWYNENSFRPGEWDNSITHAHILNHIRFYLPHLSIFDDVIQYFYFMDDDIIVQKDLSLINPSNVFQNMNNTEISLICPCNIWIWNQECHHFQYHETNGGTNGVAKDSMATNTTILQMPASYGNVDTICNNNNQNNENNRQHEQCKPANFNEFVKRVVPSAVTAEKGSASNTAANSNNHNDDNNSEITIDQSGWNFGSTLISIDNWKQNRLTEKYEYVMEQNYRYHVFPETSLLFGLGSAYLAFAGNVGCWSDTILRVRDGFGFIVYDRLRTTFSSSTDGTTTNNNDNDSNNVFDNVDVIHYTGPNKPWSDFTPIEEEVLRPWLSSMENQHLILPKQLPTTPTNNVFIVLGGTRTGIQSILSLLDQHPDVCATGDTYNGEIGYPSDVLYPETMIWYPECSVKRGCSFSYIRDHIIELTSSSLEHKCHPDYIIPQDDPLKHHLKHLCNFIAKLEGNYTTDNVMKLWSRAFVDEDRTLLGGCKCKRGVKAKGVKILTDWIKYKNFPDEPTGPSPITINGTALDQRKVIYVKRSNLWARQKSFEVAKYTNLWHIKNRNQKQKQIQKLLQHQQNGDAINVTTDLMKWNMINMERSDQAGDDWVKDHALDVLYIDYDECYDNVKACLIKMFNFINVDPAEYFAQHQQQRFNNIIDNDANSLFWNNRFDKDLQYIGNGNEVASVLNENNWGHFLVSSGNNSDGNGY